jgi:hypothetical protein
VCDRTCHRLSGSRSDRSRTAGPYPPGRASPVDVFFISSQSPAGDTDADYCPSAAISRDRRCAPLAGTIFVIYQPAHECLKICTERLSEVAPRDETPQSSQAGGGQVQTQPEQCGQHVRTYVVVAAPSKANRPCSRFRSDRLDMYMYCCCQ